MICHNSQRHAPIRGLVRWNTFFRLLGAAVALAATLSATADGKEGASPSVPTAGDAQERGVLSPNAELTPPELMRFPSHRGEVSFPHLEHIEEFEILCDECHHEVKARALDTPHPKYFENQSVRCSICHGGAPPAEAKSCEGCHHRLRRITDETLSAKVAMHKACASCHEIGLGAEASASCEGCHTGDPLPWNQRSMP